MLILHLGDVERLNHALQAPLLELGALKASQELLDILGLKSAEPGGRGRIKTREVARHLVLTELVKALRDFEGLGEDASPRRGGAGSSSPSEDACALAFSIRSWRPCHLVSDIGGSSSSSARSSSIGGSSASSARSSSMEG